MAEDEYTFDESDSETSKVLLERPTAAAASASSRRRSSSPSVRSNGSANHWSDDDTANQVRGAGECKGWMDTSIHGCMDAWMDG